MTPILVGIRVLDFTNVLSGPFATLYLALLGAEVVKIENPQDGDLARKLGNVGRLNQELMGTSFLAQNANKKSMTLNLKHEKAREVVHRLVGTADVLVENFRPGVMERLGLGPRVLMDLNPRLVYCAISGFGQSGPDAARPAYDQIIQGLSGVMDVNGDSRLHPLRAGFPVCDTVGGLTAAFAILAALFHRERSGHGQVVDVALLDSVMPLLGWVGANLLIGAQAPVPMGNDNFTAAPSGTFATRDGHINIAANKQEQWEALTDVLGLAHLKADERFQERDKRKQYRQALTVILEDALRTQDTGHWVEALNARGVPSGAILGLEAALRQPQVRHRGLLQKLDVPGVGEVELMGLPARFSRTPAELRDPPPRLGADTDAMLARLGYPDHEVKTLRASGVV